MIKQFNTFELKSFIIDLLGKINSVKEINDFANDIKVLDEQNDKSSLKKILFKELPIASEKKIAVICYLLRRYSPLEELIEDLWDVLKTSNLKTSAKVNILNLLREYDSNWSYDECEKKLGDVTDVLDENTKQLLNNAIVNPEIQIDFMDFLTTLAPQDKITLINSLSEDFSSDSLANILLPVFLSAPTSEIGKEALNLLSDSKSQLALNTLEEFAYFTKGELSKRIKRTIAQIKMSGIRDNNIKELHKKILAGSKPYKFYLSYPDGDGNIALIFTRLTDENRIRFVSIVANVEDGISDCFGFYDISQFECDKILERFLKKEELESVSKEMFKSVLTFFRNLHFEKNPFSWTFPYEYLCWRILLADIELETFDINSFIEGKINIETSDKVLEDIVEINAYNHWFIDEKSSSNFANCIKEFANNNDSENIILKYKNLIFDKEEKLQWLKRLLISTYIKHSINNNKEASVLYSIYKNENFIEKLFEQILKRSIYEYFMVIKYDSDRNIYNLSSDVISGKILYIEENWCTK